MACLWLHVAAVASAAEPLHMIVMDPLAAPLACACVPGTGQRRYDELAKHFEAHLSRPVQVTFDESLKLARERTGGRADIIIGKDSMVRHDAAKAGLNIHTIAALTDNSGSTTFKGVFLVAKNFPARSLRQLAGKRIGLGPAEEEESHGAARRALTGVAVAWKHFGSMDAAAIAMNDGEVDAAVVSDFLPRLLEGCGKLDKGEFKVIGETAPLAFIRVFANTTVDTALEERIVQGLLAVADQPALLAAMESKSGFVKPGGESVTAWTDWRGPNRAGVVPQLPQSLPAQLPVIWRAGLTGPAMAGPAATEELVVVPDKSEDFKRDVFRCLSAKDGATRWTYSHPAPDDLEYSNAPRATPVIHDGRVYVQGALGHLHCLELATGKVLWQVHLYTDFGADKLTWGTSVPPLVVDDVLIVAPGAKHASVAALDLKTGRVRWQTPGHSAAYSAFIRATFDGVDQIIGYDVAGLGGWNPKTGQRLWELVPPGGADFNVTTPVVLGNQLLLAAENNATRLHSFDGKGRIVQQPASQNKDMAPDTCTPAVVNGRVFATAYGELFCLDARDGLKTIWRKADDMFHDHSNIVAGKDHVLVWTMSGDLLLVDAMADSYKVISHLRPLVEKHPDSMAHPAFAGDRIYLRSPRELLCLRLTRP